MTVRDFKTLSGLETGKDTKVFVIRYHPSPSFDNSMYIRFRGVDYKITEIHVDHADKEYTSVEIGSMVSPSSFCFPVLEKNVIRSVIFLVFILFFSSHAPCGAFFSGLNTIFLISWYVMPKLIIAIAMSSSAWYLISS